MKLCTRRLWSLVGTLLYTYFAPLAFAQSAAPPTTSPEAFFRNADVAEAVLSPSGKRLAITTSKGGGRVSLVVLGLEPGAVASRIAQFADVDIRDVVWVNDTRLLFSVVDQSEGTYTQAAWPGLYTVNADGSDTKELIQRKTYRITNFSSKSKALEPNHVLLKVPVSQDHTPNDEVLVGKVNIANDRTLSNLYPLWLNVVTGKSRTTFFDPPSDAVRWIFDSKGEPRVVFTLRENVRVAYWRGPGMTEWKQIVQGSLLELPFTPHAVDDAGNLFVTQTGADGFTVLKRFDFATMQPEAQALVSTPGFDFTGQLMLERGTGAAQGVRVVTDAETVVWFDERLKALQATVDQALPGHVNRISCRQCKTDQAVVLVRSFSDKNPGRLVIYRPKAAEGQAQWQAISHVKDGIDPRQMARVDFQRIQARDGRDLPVWLTLPQGVQAGKPAPAVVMVHGGPWVRGGQWAWNPMNQYLASLGYVVIEPEFRGSKGYGDAHFKAGWKQWGQAMQNDVADALLWAQQQKIATDKACIAGASYGGYSTLMGLVRHPTLYQCGIAWVAVTDLHLLVKGSWWVQDDISDISRKHTVPEMVGDAEKDADQISANSPVLLAKHMKAPLLMAFGVDDKRVPLAHGKRMREALQAEGLEPEWVTYAFEGHGWMMQKTKLDFAKRVATFLGQHLPVSPAAEMSMLEKK
jgi:dipeptidyl aminopeptidase/acylaminoacyl peptidase